MWIQVRCVYRHGRATIRTFFIARRIHFLFFKSLLRTSFTISLMKGKPIVHTQRYNHLRHLASSYQKLKNHYFFLYFIQHIWGLRCVQCIKCTTTKIRAPSRAHTHVRSMLFRSHSHNLKAKKKKTEKKLLSAQPANVSVNSKIIDGKVRVRGVCHQ